jgi:hypothetical protein
LSLKGDFGLGLLNNVKMIESFGTLENELNAFCILGLGDWGRIL